MSQAKAVINLKEGVIELEGPVEFVERYLERYETAIRGLPAAEHRPPSPPPAAEVRSKARGDQRSCIRAIRAEIRAGFFDQPKSTQSVRGRLAEKGVICSSGLVRTSLNRIVEEGRLKATGKRRARAYARQVESSTTLAPAEPPEAATASS